MIPSYTCDKLTSTYPGMDEPYACYCNNGDFHTMPTINIVLSSDSPQEYNLDPEIYMFAPFLTNSKTPSTRCMLGLLPSSDLYQDDEALQMSVILG